MTHGFDACATTLADLLRPARVFNVPTFQRPYSWTTDEAGQLLDDLLLAFEDSDGGRRGGGHFLGQIVLLQSQGPDRLVSLNDRRDDAACTLQIIDGQQRLATLTVLACVLRDLARAEKPNALPGIDALIQCQPARGESDQFRLQMRGAAQRSMAALIQTPGATLQDAPIGDYTEAETLLIGARDHFLDVLNGRDGAELERLAHFVMHACDISAAVTNDVDRAHRIFCVLNNRGRPLKRCDIICAQLMDGIAGDNLSRLHGELEQLSDRLGSDFDMLFSHIRSAIGDVRTPVIADILRLAADAGGGGAFIETMLLPFGRALDDIVAADHRGSAWSDEINLRLRQLSWIPSGEWIPPALLWWRRYAGDPMVLAKALTRLVRLTFGIRVLGLGADKRQTRMQQLRSAIEEGRPLVGADGPLEFSSEEVRNIRHNLKDLHRRSQPTCRLLMLLLESEASGHAPSNIDELTVEHLLPQKPARNSRWRDWFSDADERQSCTSSLGNLVLVPRSLNERARNQEFGAKMAIFFAPDAPTLPQLTTELREIAEWNVAEVRAREQRLMAMIDGMWHLGKMTSAQDGMPDEVTALRGRSRRNRKVQAVG
jgi:hypothetical protein